MWSVKLLGNVLGTGNGWLFVPKGVVSTNIDGLIVMVDLSFISEMISSFCALTTPILFLSYKNSNKFCDSQIISFGQEFN